MRLGGYLVPGRGGYLVPSRGGYLVPGRGGYLVPCPGGYLVPGGGRLAPSLPERGGSFLGQVWLPFGQSAGLDGLPFSRSSGIVVGIGWPVLCLLE